MKKALFSILILFLIVSIEASAQEKGQIANENSVYPIPYNNQMYKRTVWRRMDLKEKQNRPFFSTSNEITRIIISAVENGLIYPYEDDSLNKRMSKVKKDGKKRLFMLNTCVGHVKQFLGINHPFVWTPYQLYKHMKR